MQTTADWLAELFRSTYRMHVKPLYIFKVKTKLRNGSRSSLFCMLTNLGMVLTNLAIRAQVGVSIVFFRWGSCIAETAIIYLVVSDFENV